MSVLLEFRPRRDPDILYPLLDDQQLMNQKWQNGSTFQRDKRIREQSDPGAFRGLVNVLAFYAACGLIYGSVYLVVRVMR